MEYLIIFLLVTAIAIFLLWLPKRRHPEAIKSVEDFRSRLEKLSPQGQETSKNQRSK